MKNTIRTLSEDQIKEILAKYTDTNEKTEAIAAEFGLTRQTLYSLLRMNNVAWRNPGKSNSPKRGTTQKTCPKCRKKIDIKGARFCPFCASDIRSKNELLIERLNRITPYATFLPSEVCDEFISVINEVAKELEKER